MSKTNEQNGKSPKSLDQALRPALWNEYVGQSGIKENLRILLSAAKGREHQPEHVLLYGPPGLGKTTLAHLMSREIGANLRATSGPAIERIGDLASILTNLAPGDILFIDEIQRLKRPNERIRQPGMGGGCFGHGVGKGAEAPSLQLELPAF